MGLLVGRHRQRSPETESPRRLADRGLGYELFQALVGAVLPDDDDHDASLLNGPASHAAHATTRVSNTQGIAKALLGSVLQRTPWSLTLPTKRRIFDANFELREVLLAIYQRPMV